MRNTIVFCVLLGLTVPSALAADVVLRQRDPGTTASAVPSAARTGRTLTTKEDPPSYTLIVPGFRVDTTSPTGATTLFAVRNITESPLDVLVTYATVFADFVRSDPVTLGPRETYTRNVRDVGGLPVDGDGFARGYAFVEVSGASDPDLVGDFLQVDVAQNFATGDRMVRLEDLCNKSEIRFLDFGDGTELTLLLFSPNGSDPMTDPPSASLTAYDEHGMPVGAADLYTEQFLVTFDPEVLTATHFGTIVFDFSNSGGGLAYATYSAEGKFSVGMNSACLE